MTISVVIPALDEAPVIRQAVESARAPGVEVLVVDGGSRDATVERARSAGAIVVPKPTAPVRPAAAGRTDLAGPSDATGPPGGRAHQLDAGFRASSGDPVLFLHADTRLPAGWDAAVRRALSRPGVVGGAFRFAFSRDAGRPLALRFGLACVEWGARLRVALFRLPYGDQAIFVRRGVLEEIGGIAAAPIMEDLDLVRAMKRHGRIALLPLEAPTSPRRHLEHGVLRTALRHVAAAAAWKLGLDRARVAAWVRR